jgi:hypothetical protein
MPANTVGGTAANGLARPGGRQRHLPAFGGKIEPDLLVVLFGQRRRRTLQILLRTPQQAATGQRSECIIVQRLVDRKIHSSYFFV